MEKTEDKPGQWLTTPRDQVSYKGKRKDKHEGNPGKLLEERYMEQEDGIVVHNPMTQK